jgi:hypothetical protein
MRESLGPRWKTRQTREKQKKPPVSGRRWRAISVGRDYEPWPSTLLVSKDFAKKTDPKVVK